MNNDYTTQDHELEGNFVIEEEKICDYKNMEIDIISIFLSKLESIPCKEQSIDYQQIVQIVQDFLKKKCQHILILDNIDIDPEHSQPIIYCVKCGITLPNVV